jgi:hypothetical protein
MLVSPSDSTHFFDSPETFFACPGLHTQANTRPADHPPSGQLDSPRGEYKGRREDLARLSFFNFSQSSSVQPILIFKMKRYVAWISCSRDFDGQGREVVQDDQTIPRIAMRTPEKISLVAAERRRQSVAAAEKVDGACFSGLGDRLATMDNGAQERTRTSTPLREPGPEPGASASSATWAQVRYCEANSFCPPPFALSTRALSPSQLLQTEPERGWEPGDSSISFSSGHL